MNIVGKHKHTEKSGAKTPLQRFASLVFHHEQFFYMEQ